MGRSARLRLILPGLLLLCQAANGQDMDDVLGGFDDLDSDPVIQLAEEIPELESASDRTWDLGGSLGLAASYNHRSHRSSTGTRYGGLSRLRLRGDLKLQWRPHEHWRGQLDAYATHDLVYALRDETYTDEVLAAYENELEVQEASLQGRLGSRWDLKLGRQVAAWGFADSLRVLDVLNPLDQRTPGLADIEDLRLPVGMLRLDHYAGPWQWALMLIPEQRFSRNPAYGSDFYLLNDEQGEAVRLREVRPESLKTINYALALTGRFPGWDLSLNMARYWQDLPYLDGTEFDADQPGADEDDFYAAAVLRHSRVNLIGFGLQATSGSWLFKQEAALIQDQWFTASREASGDPLPGFTAALGLPRQTGGQVPDGLSQHRVYQALLGVEYYGFAQTSLSLELTQQQIADFSPALARSGYLRRRNEAALRISRDFFNARLRTMLIAIRVDRDGHVLGAGGGALTRLDAQYELADNWALSAGLLIFSRGEEAAFRQFAPNDRSFIELKRAF